MSGADQRVLGRQGRRVDKAGRRGAPGARGALAGGGGQQSGGRCVTRRDGLLRRLVSHGSALRFGFPEPCPVTARAAGGWKPAEETGRTFLRVAPLDSTSAPGHIGRIRSRAAKRVRRNDFLAEPFHSAAARTLPGVRAISCEGMRRYLRSGFPHPRTSCAALLNNSTSHAPREGHARQRPMDERGLKAEGKR